MSEAATTTTATTATTALPWHAEVLRAAGAAGATAATLVWGEAGSGCDELALALSEVYGGRAFKDYHPDRVVIAPEKNTIAVDAVRAIPQFFSMAAIECDCRVAVILRADRMNESAANMLLKTLEEPTAKRRIILSCPSLRALPATVISRCRLMKTPPPTAAQARQWLRDNAVEDGDGVLAFCRGMPLLSAQMPDNWLRTLRGQFGDGGRMDVLAAAAALGKNDGRLDWLDGLQKWVSDGARAAFGLPVCYYPDGAAALRKLADGRGGAWLDFYRQLLAYRALAAHPLSKDIFIKSVLNEYKQLCAG